MCLKMCLDRASHAKLCVSGEQARRVERGGGVHRGADLLSRNVCGAGLLRGLTLSAASVLVRGPSAGHLDGSTLSRQKGLFLWLRQWKRSTTILTDVMSHLRSWRVKMRGTEGRERPWEARCARQERGARGVQAHLAKALRSARFISNLRRWQPSSYASTAGGGTLCLTNVSMRKRCTCAQGGGRGG